MPVASLFPGRWLREIVLYVGASPASHWHQLDSLRDLDDRLLKDIGICRQAAACGRPQDSRAVAAWARDTLNSAASGA